MSRTAPAVDPGQAPASSLAMRAYEELRRRLVRVELQPLEPLDEQRLSRELGIGLAPIREAFKRLEQDHLVVIYPRRGTFAAPVGLGDLQAVTELRIANETLAVTLATERATTSERQALHRLATEVSQARGEAMMRGDERVHLAIADAARNSYLRSIIERHMHLAVRLWFLCHKNYEIPTDVAVDHTPTTAAILDGDSDAAVAGIRDHIQHDSDHIAQLLAARGQH